MLNVELVEYKVS